MLFGPNCVSMLMLDETLIRTFILNFGNSGEILCLALEIKLVMNKKEHKKRMRVLQKKTLVKTKIIIEKPLLPWILWMDFPEV